MFNYKGFAVWVNSNQEWIIQDGYEILARCKTVGSAKGWITKFIKKNNL